MKYATDVVIVGGGVIGCAIAFHLRKQGVDVVVLDKGAIGAQASSAATGMLAPLRPFIKLNDPYTNVLLASLALFPELISEVEYSSCIDVEYIPTGTLCVVHAKQVARLQTWIATWQQKGVPLQLLAEDEIRHYEPGLAENTAFLLYNPHEAQLNAPQLVKAYAVAAEKMGAILYPYEDVIHFDSHNTRVTGVQTAQGNLFSCKHVVIAAGAWSAHCGELLGLAVPVYPLRGQCIVLRQPTQPVQHMLFGEGIYLAPRCNGTVIVGATKEEAGFEVQTTLEGKTLLHQAAKRLFPAFNAAVIEDAWAGLRPKTPDARPILGRVPQWENVLLACGHNGFGVLLSAITGRVIAEQIITGCTPEVLRPFSLERFMPDCSE